jgi:hypothetical protein
LQENTQGELQNQVKHASSHGILDSIDSTQFLELLAHIQDEGLLDISVDEGKSVQTDSRRRLIKLRCQQGDVELALKKTLGDNSYFRDLMEKTTKIYIRR